MNLSKIEVTVKCTIDHEKADILINELKQKILNECISITIGEDKPFIIQSLNDKEKDIGI